MLPGVNIERVDLATVQAQSDFISLHAALNQQTQGMIDHTFLR
ncbi:MAG: NAD(P)-dependent oxidoreductase [Bdellovibrionota bacterium]